MIYLDNSATSYPKPQAVIGGIANLYRKYGSNAGRGGYKMAIETTTEIYNCRRKLADFFGAPDSCNVIFTYNCTTALNMAIKGIARQGGHFIISDLEHNAVLRPLAKLKQSGVCDYDIACIKNDKYETLKSFQQLINKNTVAIACTGASNVFGIVPPWREIAHLAHENGLLFILDCAQIGGVIPVNMKADDIDILCCAGHKGLMGVTGTGVLIFNNNVALNTLIEGGTGSNSASEYQPEEYPDRLESGTPNVQGIIALSRSIDFINKIGVNKIYKHEISLMKYLQKHLSKNEKIELYTDFFDSEQTLSPILSFNVKGYHSEQVADYLSGQEIAVRAGLHCAPLAHKKMKTDSVGAVRISPSVFTQKNHIDFLINCVRKFAK